MSCLRLLFLMVFVLSIGGVKAQDEKALDLQRRKVEQLQQQIKKQETELANIKQSKNASQQRLSHLTRQIENRSDLISINESKVKDVKGEISTLGLQVDSLTTLVQSHEAQYSEMVRMAYRNYRSNSYLAYLFTSDNFAEVTRKIAMLRAMSQLRGEQIAAIKSLKSEIESKQGDLESRNKELEQAQSQLLSQRSSLERDSRSARSQMNSLSAKERKSLSQKLQQERDLEAAINELRRLTKGNTTGDTFTSSTSGLNLPVVGGSVKRYLGNMAEVVGRSGSKVISIYDGKVVDVKLNRITNRYDLFIAHGEYITSYANLATVTVKKGATVAKGGQIGTIGVAVDLNTMKSEYKIVFGIYAPSPSVKMNAKNCFTK